jgi:hypothetical protein
MVQVKGVPEDVHRALKARAASRGQSLSDYLRGEMERSLRARPQTSSWGCSTGTRPRRWGTARRGKYAARASALRERHRGVAADPLRDSHSAAGLGVALAASD